MIVAELTGAARRHSRWRELTGAGTVGAVAGLREIAGGRSGLLAGVAGILPGAHEGALDEPEPRAAARLCRLAGAGEDLSPQWAAEGKGRAATARMRHSRRPPA